MAKEKKTHTSPTRSRGEEKLLAEIDAERLEMTLRNPALQRFLAEASTADARLHREGRIHP